MSVLLENLSLLTFHDCGFIGKYGVVLTSDSYGYFGHCGFMGAASGYQFLVKAGAVSILWESVNYGSKSGDIGVYCTLGGVIAIYGNEEVRHCAVGVQAETGGQIQGSIVYTDNTTNASPATFATHVGVNGAFISDIT
jgi:hypothetical protein